jgi:hypothetical protein
MPSLKAQKATAPAFMPNDGRGVFLTDKAVLGAASGGGLGTPVALDTIDFLVPAGFQLCDLAFVLDDSDTGAAFVFGVGYRAVNTASSLATNATYFAAAGQTTGQAGGRLECSFKPIQFEEDVFIQLLVGVAPAGISGNPEIHMIAGGNCRGPK